MKKIQFLILFALTTISVSAQYEKASIHSKGGQTYTLGATVHMMGDGKGSPIGFYFSGGNDNTDRHLFHWYEIVAIPAFKYTYQTSYYDINSGQNLPATVSGKSKFHLLYNYNVGYHLLNRNGKIEQKLQPYVFLGIGAVVFGRADEPEVPNYDDYKKKVTTQGLSLGARGGLGVVYNITDRIGIKSDMGYNYQHNWEGDGYANTEMYNMYTSHFFIYAGFRFRFLENRQQ